MKILLLISLMTSINAYSAQVCDLTVQVPQVEGGTVEIVTADASASVSGKENDTQYQKTILTTAAMNECARKGGQECAVKTSKDYVTFAGGTFTNRRATYHYDIRVEGKKFVGGKKITDAQYAKKRARILCQKIDVCINNAINDNNSTLLYMEKLSLAKNMNKCNEIENVIFEN